MRFLYILHIECLVQCEENKEKIYTKKVKELKRLVNLQLTAQEQLGKCMDEIKEHLIELGEWEHNSNNTSTASPTLKRNPCPLGTICSLRLERLSDYIIRTYLEEICYDDYFTIPKYEYTSLSTENKNATLSTENSTLLTTNTLPTENTTPSATECTTPSTTESATPSSLSSSALVSPTLKYSSSLASSANSSASADSSALVSATKKEVLFFPTTTSIVLLADLMVAATSKDFKLIAAEPLVLIKYPDSFQATVVQTTNRGYDALNEAQKSMAQLVQIAERTIVLASEGLNVIENGEASDTQDLLPITLDEITTAVAKCTKIIDLVVGKYDELLNLIHEILTCNGPSEATRHLLQDTAQEMGAVRDQWVFLVNFFRTITETIKGSLSNTIEEFTQIVQQENSMADSKEPEGEDNHATTEKEDASRENSTVEESFDKSVGAGDGEEANENENNEELDKSIVESANVKEKKNLLMQDMQQISDVAKKIRATAVIYSEISQRHLMKSILSLNSFAAMNPTKDAATIEGLQKEIMQECLLADRAISLRKT